jgi:hypothetical protein
METLKSELKTHKKPEDFSDDTRRLRCEIFGTLSIMCGAELFSLPSGEEMESLLANLDLFTSIEFEHLLKFIDRFLKRMAYLIVDNICYYLNHLKCDDTIEHFLDTIGDELSKINLSYNSCPFESLLVMYLSDIYEGEGI